MKKLFLTICFLLVPISVFAASSRVLPDSYNESTYGDATRDYTSLATWEADTDNDLVTATTGEVLTCYDDSTPYDDTVSISGATTSSDYFRVIRAADEQRGTPTTGVRFERVSTTTTILLTLDEEYSQIHDIAVKLTSSNNSIIYGFKTTKLSNAIIGCISYDFTTSNMAIGYRIVNGKLINSAAKNIDGNLTNSAGASIGDNGDGTNTIYIYNSTITGCNQNGILSGSPTEEMNLIYLKNSIIVNNGTNIATFGSGVHTYNQTTNATSGVTFDADGYHLASSDTGAIDQGTDLSSDAIFSFDDDIDGDTRSVDWDIGCDEYISSTWIPKVIIY